MHYIHICDIFSGLLLTSCGNLFDIDDDITVTPTTTLSGQFTSSISPSGRVSMSMRIFKYVNDEDSTCDEYTTSGVSGATVAAEGLFSGDDVSCLNEVETNEFGCFGV